MLEQQVDSLTIATGNLQKKNANQTESYRKNVNDMKIEMHVMRLENRRLKTQEKNLSIKIDSLQGAINDSDPEKSTPEKPEMQLKDYDPNRKLLRNVSLNINYTENVTLIYGLVID